MIVARMLGHTLDEISSMSLSERNAWLALLELESEEARRGYP